MIDLILAVIHFWIAVISILFWMSTGITIAMCWNVKHPRSFGVAQRGFLFFAKLLWEKIIAIWVLLQLKFMDFQFKYFPEKRSAEKSFMGQMPKLIKNMVSSSENKDD